MKKNHLAFYPSMAFSNIRKNKRLYFPYILTCICTVAMFYIMSFISFNEGLIEFPGAQSLKFIMELGTVVVGLFSSIFLFYTNSFLIKRRKKEIGLYNILGMEKRNIALMLFFETIGTMIVSLIIGLGSGMIFSRLLYMVLCKLVGFSGSLSSSFSPKAIIVTLIVFAAVFFLILLFNLARISLSKPIELLHGGNVGEREPKSKWIMALIGIITTGIGYYIALTVESPLDAILLFFVAVILVMLGTYSLFTAGSIAILKILRKNKKYYYQTKHFTAVSGMIYRMKQNAVGLANICVLSAGVLILVSTTVSMYIGVEDAIDGRYPHDISITQYISERDDFDREEHINTVKRTVGEHGLSVKYFREYEYLGFATVKDGETFSCAEFNYSQSRDIDFFFFISAAEYESATGEKLSLLENEAVIFDEKDALPDKFSVEGSDFTVKKRLDSFFTESYYTGIINSVHFVVVADSETVTRLYDAQHAVYGDEASSIEYITDLDISGEDDEKLSCFYDTLDAVSRVPSDEYIDENGQTQNTVKLHTLAESRQENARDFYSTYGGFLFIGVFLGVLFLMITVLIIYYKQISEGYDDKGRFEIMQKVGMSRGEIKKTIHSQILTVFFLPLIGACIHTAVSFRLMTKILRIFSLTNTTLFLICMAVTVAIFAVIYLIIYSLTAKSYYKIVE